MHADPVGERRRAGLQRALRGQGGEEVLIGATPATDGGGTRVTGSTYLFDAQVARFFATLPPAATEAA